MTDDRKSKFATDSEAAVQIDNSEAGEPIDFEEIEDDAEDDDDNVKSSSK